MLQLGQRVTSMLDLDTLLPEACHLIAEAFEYDMVGIRWDPDRGDNLVIFEKVLGT